jgi:hypothetical protein
VDRSAVRTGVVGGILGGVLMAAWLMFFLWLTGAGFWTLLNLITNTFLRSAPLGPRFSLSSLVIGLVVHVLMSVLFGVIIATAASRLPGSRSLVIAGGALFGAVLWAVMQYGIWRAVDAPAARVITPWLFSSAHLLFGLLVATVAAIVIPDVEGAHAVGARGALDARRLSGMARGGRHGDLVTSVAGRVTHEQRLTARNDGGMRTVIYTGAGPGMVTDEIAPLGGFTTAPTPLESVIGALCGSIGVTFAKASRDIGLGYSGIDFEASFALDARSPAGQSETAGHFDAVSLHALVHDAQPSAWLDDVGRTALRRCPVTRLLADAGVAVEMTWSDVPPEPLARQVPQARRWLAGQPQSPSGYLPR